MTFKWEVATSTLKPVPEQTLTELLASLPEEERLILSLHYLKSQTPSQIARMLGVPERAVISVISMAKTRLLSSIIATD